MRLSLENVVVRYGTTAALRGVSLAAAPGEHVAVVGPSGGGKSTLLRLLNAAVMPAEGTVRVNDLELTNLPENKLCLHRSKVGFVHQQLALIPNLRVAANLAAAKLGQVGFLQGLRQVMFPNKKERAGMLALLARVGMQEYLHRRVDRLSGGQQQRVAIARALWQLPKLMVADEPVSSLDPMRAREVLELLTSLATQDGLTLMVSLHQLELAREFFPRLIGLRDGRIVFDKPSPEIGQAEFRELFEIK